MKYSCPCCGYYTFPVPAEQAVRLHLPRMFWETMLFIESNDEPSDENHGLTLNEGRENFKKHAVVICGESSTFRPSDRGRKASIKFICKRGLKMLPFFFAQNQESPFISIRFVVS